MFHRLRVLRKPSLLAKFANQRPTLSAVKSRLHLHYRRFRTMSFLRQLLFVLILLIFWFFLASVLSLCFSGHHATTMKSLVTSMNVQTPPKPPVFHLTPTATTDFVSLGWVQTAKDVCRADGPAEKRVANTSELTNLSSGYCQLQNVHTGELIKAVRLDCGSIFGGIFTSCAEIAADVHLFDQISTKYSYTYKYEPKTIAKEPKQQLIQQANKKLRSASVAKQQEQPPALTLSNEQGIIMCVYDKVLYGAYATIKILRGYGCTLPIELWFKETELKVNNAILVDLVQNHNVRLRIINGQESVVGFQVKPYAVYHSSFEKLLLLDADNVPVRDPTYLFYTKEFREKGAIFWPDFWQPSRTIFNSRKGSLLWEIIGLPFVDMFEQESGQILINKKNSGRALDMLMFYTFHKANLLNKLGLVWGDKDLFRLAWLKTKKSFHMIKHPPSNAGVYNEKEKFFCGMTMVQYDPSNRIVFLHRNFGKISGDEHDEKIWDYIQEFDMSRSLKEYTYQTGVKGVIFDRPMCYGIYDYKSHLEATNNSPLVFVRKSNFQKVESNLLQYAKEARKMLE